MSPRPGDAESRRRKMFVLADHLGLSDEERIEFARVILWRDVTSWRKMTEDEVNRMLDALEGAEKYLELLRQRV